MMIYQPPSGGCVLKQVFDIEDVLPNNQPPSGGCVLKRYVFIFMAYFFSASRLRAAVC